MKNQHIIFIITTIVVLVVMPPSIFALEFQLDGQLMEESAILKTGKFFTTAKEYNISNDFDDSITQTNI